MNALKIVYNMGLKNEVFRFVDLRINSKDEKCPAFVESIKNSSGGYDHAYFNSLEGKVSPGEIVVKNLKGEDVTFFKLNLKDGNETFKLEMSHGETTYSFISALAAADLRLPVEMRIWKELATDGFYYPKTMLKQKDKKVHWSININDVPKDENRRAYFEELFTDILNSL